MNKIFKHTILFLIGFMLFAGYSNLTARTNEKNEKGKNDKILARTYGSVFDVQFNSVSNISFYSTNYGIFGLNILRNEGGGYWPRGSLNQYIFGGGIWFATIKKRPGTDQEKKYCEVSYNPNSGSSWFVPGRIDDGDLVDDKDPKKYRTYFSTDFVSGNGMPTNAKDGAYWPVWDASINPADTLKKKRYFGNYISEPADRNLEKYPKGPAFISGEDIFSTYKDTDLNYFEGGASKRLNEGYPLRMQIEQTIYSWSFGDYKDFIFMRYELINYSPDTLKYCWMAPVLDIDIARSPQTQAGAANDRVKYYDCDSNTIDNLNMALQWSNTTRGERGYGFGYFGMDFLESPATHHKWDTTGKEIIEDSTNFIRRDKRVYANSEQLGLKTFKNWVLESDPKDDDQRYNWLSSGDRDGDNGEGDKRFMMATGPFHMRPRDTARVVVGMILSPPGRSGQEPDGTCEDLAELVRRDLFAQQVYDNNFEAPVAPERAKFFPFMPMNNAVKISWDSTSEMSFDKLAKGLDFMGYTLYRGRRYDLDTVSGEPASGNQQYSRGTGPFGWKQLRNWDMPTPFLKSYNKSVKANDPKYFKAPYIDSLRIVGPVYNKDGSLDTSSIRVMRVGRGITTGLYKDATRKSLVDLPTIVSIDTFPDSDPWGKFYFSHIKQGDLPLIWTPTIKHPLLDTVFCGTIKLKYDPIANINDATKARYNPIFYKRYTINITPGDTTRMPSDGYVIKTVGSGNSAVKYVDTAYFKNTIRRAVINNVSTMLIDIHVFQKPTGDQTATYNAIINDSTRLKEALDSLYSYIQQGRVYGYYFPEFEQTLNVRSNVIYPYFTKITNNRTFIDIGDDNANGRIEYSDDPTNTEKMINNVEYYYSIISRDEGDYTQTIESQKNDAGPQMSNFITTYPKAQPIGDNAEIKVIYADTDKLGGLYDFRFFTVDQGRLNQLFAGDTLELEFQPDWYMYNLSITDTNTKQPVDYPSGLYVRHMTLRNLSKNNKVLYDMDTWLEANNGVWSFFNAFTENAVSYVLNDQLLADSVSQDTSDFNRPFSHESLTRNGKFTTGDFTQNNYFYNQGYYIDQNPNKISDAYGVLGFSYNFAIKQFGGMFRGDSTTGKSSGSKAVTPVTFMDMAGNASTRRDPFLINTCQILDTIWTSSGGWIWNTAGNVWILNSGGNILNASFNNGPVDAELEFTNEGEEEITVRYGSIPDRGSLNNRTDTNFRTFKVKYLNYKVTNNTSYKRPNTSGDSVLVTYPGPIEQMELPMDITFGFPSPVFLKRDWASFINKCNMRSHGFVNGRTGNNALRITRQFARPSTGPLSVFGLPNLGNQNRYYISSINTATNDTLDFVNVINIGGINFAFDYANKARSNGTSSQWGQPYKGGSYAVDPATYVFGDDFAVGDKVKLRSTGGALGMPLPGAKVRAVVSKSIPDNQNEYTDSEMDKILVVPNPYLISHQGQKSPYDSKLYFTQLPKQCSIEIYTIAGDLVKKIEHNEFTSSEPDRVSVEIWDLLNTNRQKIQSQTLIAYIKTPGGAETIKQFSVIVGGFRIIQE
ncbi:MAG: hypothetical protein HW421_3746 [Ignavibacteria bacterium]|nr:hypothetical protein [Ignavibacteria bacterium]